MWSSACTGTRRWPLAGESIRRGFKIRACLPRLFDQLAKAGQNEFAVLFNRFVSKDAQRIEEYADGLLIGPGCFSKSELKQPTETAVGHRTWSLGAAIGGTAQEHWRARDPALTISFRNLSDRSFRSSVSRREKQSISGLADGLVNPGSSTDRNPDRSIDDGVGAIAATDTLPGAGNNGSAGSPRGSNKVSGQPGRCRRESLHLPWIGWVPKQSDRVQPIPREKFFSYNCLSNVRRERQRLAWSSYTWIRLHPEAFKVMANDLLQCTDYRSQWPEKSLEDSASTK